MLSAHANLLRKDLFSFGAALTRLLPPCNCVDLLRTVVVSETILSGQVWSVVLFLALTFFLRRLLQTNVLEVGLLNAFFWIVLSFILVPGNVSIQIRLQSDLIQLRLPQNFCGGVLLLLQTAFGHLELYYWLTEVCYLGGNFWGRASTVVSVGHRKRANLVLKYGLTIWLDEISLLLLTVSIAVAAKFWSGSRLAGIRDSCVVVSSDFALNLGSGLTVRLHLLHHRDLLSLCQDSLLKIPVHI